uniref:RNA-binding protein 48 n=1 Tax=Sinocyclocheilus anshuiensis TaxID=1608454 RepID=A0A671S4V5_9TELE
ANPSVWDTQKVYKHHEQQNVAQTRPKYREGRRLKAVKVYTINLESRFLIVQGVPAIGVMTELVQLFALYGVIEEYRALDEYPAEQFTEVYLFKLQKLTSARVAKWHTDEKSFFGSQLHVCYAPEYETVEETRQKLQDRRRYVNRATESHRAETHEQLQHLRSRKTLKMPERRMKTLTTWAFLCFPHSQWRMFLIEFMVLHSHYRCSGPQIQHYPHRIRWALYIIPCLLSQNHQSRVHVQKNLSPSVRFKPRTTHLESRKRKLEEQVFFLNEASETETLIGPKLPELPKVDMEDQSLNVTASLIRQTMSKVSLSEKKCVHTVHMYQLHTVHM